MNAGPQTAVNKVLSDKDRQWRLYRADKRRQYVKLFADPVYGERLKRLSGALTQFGIDDAERMLSWWIECCRVWLRAAPEDIRFAALEMVGHRIARIRQRAGLCEFDDALPEEEPCVWTLCKRESGL